MIINAAGIMFLTKDGRTLFLLRGEGGDYPLTWCVPGGRAEGDEDALDAAIRETKEEAGRKVARKELALLARSISIQATDPPPVVVESLDPAVTTKETEREPNKVDFTTFIVKIDEEFTPELDDESVGYCWAPLKNPPEPLHPGVRIAVERPFMNELDVARAMSQDRLTSPQRFANMTLWDMRITGTGYAYRKAREEHVWRRPEEWLTEDLLARCNGMPVIMEHPKSKPLLDSAEFNKRIVGMIFLPYMRPDVEEIWGIAKVYDDATNELLDKYMLSTSPGVLIGPDAQALKLPSGKTILVEGDPLYCDHVAICDLGVWDHQKEPVGVRNDSDEPVTDVWAAPENVARLDAIVTRSRDLRVESFHRRATARP